MHRVVWGVVWAASVFLLMVGGPVIKAAGAADRAVAGAAFKRGTAAMLRGDYRRARAALERALANGARGAAYNLGVLYMSGWGVARDPKRACDYFKIAAAAKVAKSTHNLAQCYYHGLGRPRDDAKAVGLYRRAAALGYLQSKCALGNMYRNGRGVPRDVRRGIALCTEAAAAGDADAQADIGTIYLRGVSGVPANHRRAAMWLGRASRQGQPNAQLNYGLMHMKGDGVVRNDARGVCWVRAAALRGQRSAPFVLGRYYYPRGVRPKVRMIIDAPATKALVWLSWAARVDPRPRFRQAASKAARALLALKPQLRALARAERQRLRAQVIVRSPRRRFVPADCP